jgi:hypothetical protein
MICPQCGSRISPSANPCPNCFQRFTSEFGRVPHFPGLAIDWIECPWCNEALKLCGTLDTGGDTERQHRERRRKTLTAHSLTCRKRIPYGEERCARCDRIVTVIRYFEGRLYGPCCLTVARNESQQPTPPRPHILSKCPFCSSSVRQDRLASHIRRVHGSSIQSTPELHNGHELINGSCVRCGCSKIAVIHFGWHCKGASSVE